MTVSVSTDALVVQDDGKERGLTRPGSQIYGTSHVEAALHASLEVRRDV